MLLHANSQSLTLLWKRGGYFVWQQLYGISGVLGGPTNLSEGCLWRHSIPYSELSGLMSAITFLLTLWIILYGLVVYTKLHNSLYFLYPPNISLRVTLLIKAKKSYDGTWNGLFDLG